MNGKPCPDCAHTDHPGQYVGFAFERSPCRTCGGSATIGGMRTYDVDSVKIEFFGIEVTGETFRCGIPGIDTGKVETISTAACGVTSLGAAVADAYAEGQETKA